MFISIRKWVLVASATMLCNLCIEGQEILTMEKALSISVENSPDLQKSQLNLERYDQLLVSQRASLKARFGLNLNPADYNKSRSFDQRTSQWYNNERFATSGTFSITQPIIWTDATISLSERFGWQNNVSQIFSGTGSTDNTNRAFFNDLTLTLNQPLFTYNKAKMNLRSIEMDYENALISYALQRLNLERNITQQFYSVYMAQNNLLISQGELEDAEKNLAVIQNKVDADLSTKDELYQAQLNVSTAQSTVQNRIVNLQNSKDDLKKVLGMPLSEEFTTIVEINAEPVKVNVEKAIEQAKSSRLELRQREISRIKMEDQLTVIKSQDKFSGNIGASIGISGNDAYLEDIFNKPTQSPRVALSFSVPIFDWGARKANIKAQEISIKMTDIDTEEEIKQMEIDVRKSCRSLDNLLTQIEIAKQSVENAQRTYDLNAERYRNGDLTGMQMSQFQSQLSNQKISYSQTLINYKIELLNLKIISLYDFEHSLPIIPLETYVQNRN